MGKNWMRASMALACAAALYACDSGGSGKSGGDGGAKDGGDTGSNTSGPGGSSGGDASANNNTTAGNMDGAVPAAGTGTVKGFAYDTSSPPLPKAGVVITGPGGESATTNEKGAFTLKGVAVSDDVTLGAQLADYSAGVRNVDVVKGGTTFVEFFLKRTFKGSFDADKGGYIVSPEGAGVKFKSASVVNKKDGKAYKGRVDVELAPIDPTNPVELKAFPGHFHAVNGKKQGLLETYVPMEVKAKGEKGEDLQIKKGETATYEFPIPAGLSTVPDEIDVWTLDEKTGVWGYEGKAKKAKNEDGKEIYTTEVKHMSWWNCDAFISSITCVRGCVEQGGNPVAGAVVTFTGVGWRFRGTDTTDGEGCVYANLQQSSEVSVFAANASGFSKAETITTDDASKRWETDKQACQNIGILDLEEAPVGSTCPAGYTDCDGTCRDLQNDTTFCGASCDTAGQCSGRGDFAATGPGASICRGGECECPTGWLLCGATTESLGTCVNAQRNRQQCGTSCENLVACTNDQVCLNGACTALTCPSPSSLCSGNPYTDPSCADLQTDVNHCGTCSTRCGNRGTLSASQGGFTCEAGVCECAGDRTFCGPYEKPNHAPFYTCPDTKTDPGNCGGCYQLASVITEARACADDQACTTSTCTDLSCGAGQAACGHACVDVTANNQNCGECGRVCYGGQSCVNSACACPNDQLLCGESCIDTDTDEYNCGGCNGAGGTTCTAGQECVGGTCQALDCGSKTLCGSACVDTQIEESHCGGCFKYCGGTCVGGDCTCPGGQKVCCPDSNQAYCTAEANPCGQCAPQQ